MTARKEKGTRRELEQSFRDFKTHLGIRGLQLRARVVGRLLLACGLVYAVLLSLGVSPAGEQARRDLEILRQQPRHGIWRSLSVVSHPRALGAQPLRPLATGFQLPSGPRPSLKVRVGERRSAAA